MVDMVLDLRARQKQRRIGLLVTRFVMTLAEAGFQVKDTKDGVTWKLDR